MRALPSLRLAALLAAVPLVLGAAALAPRSPDESRVVSARWLAEHANDPAVVVLHVTHDSMEFAHGHVPGARELSYDAIVTRRDSLSSELPSVAQLRAAFERVGVSDGSRVVVYAAHAPMATRVLFTLDYLGHERWALLDGGLAQWRADGGALSTATPAVKPGRLTPRPRPELVVDASWISARLGRPGVALVDTRTDGEYDGTAGRSGMPSEGHLAGARQLQWEQLFVPGEPLRLKPRAELERLYGERARAGDTVVAYCWVGYRASATWFAARHLGYQARLYDGSYQDWLRRRLPVTRGTTP